MNADERLGAIHDALVAAGMRVLVMEGHAVRFYGVERNTIDYDLHLAGDDWERLPAVVRTIFAAWGESVQEVPVWRPGAFRRFVIGRLPDGRDERLECWLKNHLLAPFPKLFEQRIEGLYGGKRVAFLGLKDLIRSKETERESDWKDIALLEEIHDERLAAAASTPEATITALADLRSRRGFESASRSGLLKDLNLVAAALRRAHSILTVAFLAPFAPAEADSMKRPPGVLGEILGKHLKGVSPGSPRHMALVETARRLYKRDAMEADRRDKLEAAGAAPPPAG